MHYYDSDTVDDTIDPAEVEFSYDSGSGNYTINRSVAVWDLTSIPANSVYIVNARVRLNSPAFSPAPVDSPQVGITQSFIEKFTDTRKAAEYQLTRDPSGADPDTYTLIADLQNITSKNSATFNIYQEYLSTVISLDNQQGLQVGIHHKFDLVADTPTGLNKVYFLSGDNVSGVNRPTLLLTTCNNCVHILGNTQILGGQIK